MNRLIKLLGDGLQFRSIKSYLFYNVVSLPVVVFTQLLLSFVCGEWTFSPLVCLLIYGVIVIAEHITVGVFKQ